MPTIGTSGGSVAAPPPADTVAWLHLASSLTVSPSVHEPSTFSAALAAHLPAVEDATVLDVGCGAGLLTIAALSGGARHVVALDRDLAALQDTRDNVHRVLGDEGSRCLSLFAADWSHLELLRCDVAIANPQQRPSMLLDGLRRDLRHLHEGAGEDGADAIRSVLRASRADAVAVTVSSLLPVDPASLTTERYPCAQRLHELRVEHDPVWAPLRTSAPPTVGIWLFTS